jgi:hypothetical protein
MGFQADLILTSTDIILITKYFMENLLRKITESDVAQPIRKFSYISSGYVSNTGTGVIIKLKDKYYLSCLYHSFLDKNNKIDEEAISGLGVIYKTYLGNFDRENIKPENLLLIPKNPSAIAIQDDLILGEKILIMELVGVGNLKPYGYLNFDDNEIGAYLLSEKAPILNERLFAYGFPLEQNEIDFEIDDEGKTSQINRFNHRAHIFGGTCIRDELGFAIQKEDENIKFGNAVNGMSGGVVLRMCGNSIEWVGIAMRANNDLIRFIPYHLFAKSVILDILEREKQGSD